MPYWRRLDIISARFPACGLFGQCIDHLEDAVLVVGRKFFKFLEAPPQTEAVGCVPAGLGALVIPEEFADSDVKCFSEHP